MSSRTEHTIEHYELRVRIQGCEGRNENGPYVLYTAHTVEAPFPFTQAVGTTPSDALRSLADYLDVAEGREQPAVAPCPCGEPVGGPPCTADDPCSYRRGRERLRLDPAAMPPEERARLRAEGYGHLIGESRAKPTRMDDSPGYRRDW